MWAAKGEGGTEALLCMAAPHPRADARDPGPQAGGASAKVGDPCMGGRVARRGGGREGVGWKGGGGQDRHFSGAIARAAHTGGPLASRADAA